MKYSVCKKELNEFIMLDHAMVEDTERMTDKEINRHWFLIEKFKRCLKPKQLRYLLKYVGPLWSDHLLPENILGQWHAVYWDEVKRRDEAHEYIFSLPTAKNPGGP